MEDFMKKNLYFILLLLFILSSASAYTQDLTVFNFIGKKQSDIISRFGKPVHVDNSIPSMICIFYRNPNMVFVSDETGVFQADILKEYNSETSLQTALNDCIKKSINAGYKVDTISAKIIAISKQGVRAEVNIDKNNESGKYNLKIEAKRHE